MSAGLLRRSLAAMALAAGCGNACALEFRSVGSAPAVLYDAPSVKGRKVFVAPRGMPVEVVLSYGEWTKVRDAGGDLSWIESRQLSNRRTVMVTAASARIHSSSDESAPVVMTADHGVLLELADPVASGWLRIRHRDGVSGFVKATDVWGE